jgi:nucleotide-binding universal stress UspA family protein
MGIASTAPLLLSPHSLVDPPHAEERDVVRRSPTGAAHFREVLACVDGSEFDLGVMAHARAVACALGAHLTLLRVLETADADAVPADPLDWGIRRREARAHLDRLLAQLGELEAGVGAELIQGRAAEQICGWVAHHDVDLTVLCSHGSHGVSDWDLASTARKLIDGTPGSLLLIPATAAVASKEVAYRRILVPLDGSPRAESVVPIALRIAAFEGAELSFVHLLPEPEITRIGPLDAEGAELERRVAEHNERVASAYLDRLRARVGCGGVRVRGQVVRDGSVRGRLDRVIREERADLVVMSAHGHAGRIESPCGSLTEYAVTHATTPLLVVRERSERRTRRGTPSFERQAPQGLAPS